MSLKKSRHRMLYLERLGSPHGFISRYLIRWPSAMCTDGPCKPDARSTCIPYPFASSSLQSWGHKIDARCSLGLSMPPDSVSEMYSSQHKTDRYQLGGVKNRQTFHLSLSSTTPISCSTQHLQGPWQPKAANCLAPCSDVIDIIETDRC